MNPQRLTVLLANEQEGWHQTVRGLLEPQGVRTVSVRSGREVLDAIEHAAAVPIHVAVLDAQMPQLGGMAVMKMMQQRGGCPPAILLADQLSNALMQEALALRVFSVLGKPVDFNVLLDALARVVKRHYKGHWPTQM
ncbi:MAG TPA: response regulator [Tepidisphaeraceae bacterium]|jgi:CheY-like chemotaxis protein